jgi:hypothetical protein
MTTHQNAVGNALSGVTGTGNFVGSNSPTLVTPALGTPASGNLSNCTGLTVSGGGTGIASATAYTLICAGTTSTGAFQSIASVGTTGQVLTSNGAGALPTFQAAGAGSVNSGLINQLAWYAGTGTAVSGLTSANSSGLLTNSSGIPSWVTVTGTGAPVLATSPTLITPTIGAATATSLTFSPTTGGIVGTTTNNNVTAGDVGEFVSSEIALASQVSFSNATSTDLTSISLTAGDWDVWGNIFFNPSSGVCSTARSWVSSTSATIPDISLTAGINFQTTSIGGIGVPTLMKRFSLPTTTTIYVSGTCTVATGTIGASGAIYARRRR